jgi:hypothetical protein
LFFLSAATENAQLFLPVAETSEFLDGFFKIFLLPTIFQMKKEKTIVENTLIKKSDRNIREKRYFSFPCEMERKNDEQKNVPAAQNLFNTVKTLTMQYLFCKHCCFDIFLLFSKADQKQFL